MTSFLRSHRGAQQGYFLFIWDGHLYISGALRHASGLSTHTRIQKGGQLAYQIVRNDARMSSILGLFKAASTRGIFKIWEKLNILFSRRALNLMFLRGAQFLEYRMMSIGNCKNASCMCVSKLKARQRRPAK